MTYYEVELTGEVREVYSIEADTPGDAVNRWAEGKLELSESFGMQVYCVRDEDGNRL